MLSSDKKWVGGGLLIVYAFLGLYLSQLMLFFSIPLVQLTVFTDSI